MLLKIIIFVLFSSSLGAKNNNNLNLTFNEDPKNFLYTVDVYIGSPAQNSKFIVSQDSGISVVFQKGCNNLFLHGTGVDDFY